MDGVVTSVRKVDDLRFGYIYARPEFRDFFFHISQLQGGLEFGPQLMGRRVAFDVDADEHGIRAVNVRPAV